MSFFTMCVLAAGIGMALGTLGTGIGQGLAVARAVEGVSRNPGASGKILTTKMIGLAMIDLLLWTRSSVPDVAWAWVRDA